MAGPRDNVLHLFSDDGPVIEGEIIEERKGRTQEERNALGRAARAESEAQIAAVRANSAEARAAADVDRAMREKRDVVRTYRLEQEADLEKVAREQDEMRRRAYRDQQRRSRLLGRSELHAELDRRDAVLLEAVGSVVSTFMEGDGFVAKGSKKTVVELWPVEGEDKTQFLSRCVSSLTKCIGEGKAVRVCNTKWRKSEKLGKKPADEKAFVARGLEPDDVVESCGDTCVCGGQGDD